MNQNNYRLTKCSVQISSNSGRGIEQFTLHWETLVLNKGEFGKVIFIVWFYLCFTGARVWFMAAVDIQSTLKWFQLVARHADNSARLFTMHNTLNFLVIFISVNVWSAALCYLFSLVNNAFSYTCLIMTCCAYIFAIAEPLFISLPSEPLNVTPNLLSWAFQI